MSKLVFVWENVGPGKKQGFQKQKIVWVRKEERPVCYSAGVWFDNWLDVNKCHNCGAVEVTCGWCVPPRPVPKKARILYFPPSRLQRPE